MVLSYVARVLGYRPVGDPTCLDGYWLLELMSGEELAGSVSMSQSRSLLRRLFHRDSLHVELVLNLRSKLSMSDYGFVRAVAVNELRLG